MIAYNVYTGCKRKNQYILYMNIGGPGTAVAVVTAETVDFHVQNSSNEYYVCFFNFRGFVITYSCVCPPSLRSHIRM